MLETINIRSNVAVFIQIANHIRFAVASGALKQGDKLPSVRELSTRLALNPNTVAKAYRDLEVMGIVYTRRGMGIFINNNIQAKCRQECRKEIIARMHEVVAEAKASGMNEAEVLHIAEASLESDVGPYCDPPASLLALANAKTLAK